MSNNYDLSEIDAMFAEESDDTEATPSNAKSETREASGDDFPASPLTEGYHVMVDHKSVADTALKAQLTAMTGADFNPDKKGKRAKLAPGFNPSDYEMTASKDDGLIAASIDAMTAVENEHGVKLPQAGLWGVYSAIKASWGKRHSKEVSTRGFPGVGLDKETGGFRKNSYGEAHPDSEVFAAVIGLRDPTEEEYKIAEKFDIDLTEAGIGGRQYRILGTEADDLPLVAMNQDALKKALNVLLTLPADLEGPAEFSSEDPAEWDAGRRLSGDESSEYIEEATCGAETSKGTPCKRSTKNWETRCKQHDGEAPMEGHKGTAPTEASQDDVEKSVSDEAPARTASREMPLVADYDNAIDYRVALMGAGLDSEAAKEIATDAF